MARFYVYSTLTNPHRYTNWTRPTDPTKYPSIRHAVLIRGGANLATSPESKTGRHTPLGVKTEITEKDYEELMQNKIFLRHMNRGFVLVTNANGDVEKMARADMEAADKVAPLTPKSAIFNQKPQNEEEDPLRVADKSILERIKSSLRG